MGTLKLVVDEGKITAINILPAEDYLISVISSEMNATSSLEFPGVVLENKGWGQYNGWGQNKPSYDIYEEMLSCRTNILLPGK